MLGCLGKIETLFVFDVAQCVSSEGFEGGRGGLAERCVELLDGAERFAKPSAHGVAALSSASRTCSLSGDCACSLAMSSPVAVVCAASVMMYRCRALRWCR